MYTCVLDKNSLKTDYCKWFNTGYNAPAVVNWENLLLNVPANKIVLISNMRHHEDTDAARRLRIANKLGSTFLKENLQWNSYAYIGYTDDHAVWHMIKESKTGDDSSAANDESRAIGSLPNGNEKKSAPAHKKALAKFRVYSESHDVSG